MSSVPVQRSTGAVQLEMPQQRAFSRSRWSQKHDGLLRCPVQDLTEILEFLTGRLPTRALGVFALIHQEGQLNESCVQRIARVRPAPEAFLIIVLPGLFLPLFQCIEFDQFLQEVLTLNDAQSFP